jgi:thiol-disulfide isomerase/thioredoxin
MPITTTRKSMPPRPQPARLRAWLLVVALAWSIGTTTAGEAPPVDPFPAVLHLANGGFAPGSLIASSQPGRIRWHSHAFTAPFDFPLGAVAAVHYSVPTELPRPDGDYCFELAGGDVLFGSLLALNDAEADLEIAKAGRLHVSRAVINRMYCWRSSADLIYLGPNGLTGWQRVAKQPGWKEEQGQPWTNQEGATIRGDFKLPARATIEFELSWKNKPDFVFALGVGEDEKSVLRGFRFEVWERDLIIQRETEQEADVASVGEIGQGPGRVHLLTYLDQDKGRILVFSVEGKPLADLKVAGGVAQVLGGLYLSNKRGDLRLERMRIGRWNGEPPRQVDGDKARIHRHDGSIVYGQVSRFDPAKKEFVINAALRESRIPEGQIGSVFLSRAGDAGDRVVAAVYQDGSRFSGGLQRVDETTLTLAVHGIREPLELPLGGLRSLVVLRPSEIPVSIGGQAGVLELDDVRLPGRLVDGREQSGSSCLAWQPQGSSTSSALLAGVSGRIVYREPPPPQPASRRRAQEPQGPGGFIAGFLTALGGGNEPAQAGGSRKALYLRSGDVIPSEITSIDESGVSFRTALSASTFVPHDKVKAVELAVSTDPVIKLNRAKRDRLLTLPRLQKENPPTHLIRSRSGDYLRGRLIKMDATNLQVEIRLETKEIPRDRLALVVWLHPDELESARKTPEASPAGTGTRVQAVCNDGIRLTFVAERLAGETLFGKSDVLGPCQLALKEVGQLLIGRGIDKAAAGLVYQQWKLQNAIDPKAFQDDSGPSPAGRLPGTESAMVGKPAPDFELELIGGSKFHLAQARGKVIVLDFWATWCGPCLQAMPQVERIATEFRDRNVQLIAVNLQESPEQISSMLSRHKLHPDVALDRDGAVADKYSANAIPQTVIIDRAGIVARLFIGGGPHLGDQLRDALDAVLKEPATRNTSGQ